MLCWGIKKHHSCMYGMDVILLRNENLCHAQWSFSWEGQCQQQPDHLHPCLRRCLTLCLRMPWWPRKNTVYRLAWFSLQPRRDEESIRLCRKQESCRFYRLQELRSVTSLLLYSLSEKIKSFNVCVCFFFRNKDIPFLVKHIL